MELLSILLVLLAATRICGELAVRLGQPALVGELTSGILIGMLVNASPGAFPSLAGLADDAVFRALSDLGVFFLMLLAGIEMQPHKLAEGSRRSLAVAVGGMLVPLGLGVLLGFWLLPESSYRAAQILFLGTALAVTAVPVAVKILLDLGALESRAGQTIVAAALVDDVLSLLLLSILTALLRTGELLGAAEIALLAGRIALFFAVTTAIGTWLLPKLEPLARRLVHEEAEFSLLVLVALSFSLLAEHLGMHFIIGAFVAGLFFSKRSLSRAIFESVETRVSALTKGLFAPIFFASIGLHLDLAALGATPLFVAALVVVAFAGKMLGAALPARLLGMSNRESLAVGVAMSARGAVELVIADIALRAGLLEQPVPPPPIVENLFSGVVLMAIATTLLAPIGLRALLPRRGG